jgi:hypothetical protein
MAVLGTCLWCGHSLDYMNPGDPPQDCEVPWDSFYLQAHVSRDFSLVDVPLVFGKFCPSAPAHPLGMFSVHQLVSNTEQP